MKEINIAKTLVAKRKEKGITQEELASFVGVSKASVSKWETALSYPDISLLPQLAAYFDISIDELVDYSPQMTPADIIILYQRLATSFSTQPFDDVLMECRAIIKKYYSCFPLISQMSILLTNHYMLAESTEKQEQIIMEIQDLCSHIITHSDDTNLLYMATQLKAMCYIALKQPLEVLDLLGEVKSDGMNSVSLLAKAHLMMNNVKKANEVLQSSNYVHIQSILSNAVILMTTWATDTIKFERLVSRMQTVMETFNFDHLNANSALIFYLSAAQKYAAIGNIEKAVDFLQKYADLCIAFPFHLTFPADDFFDCIEEMYSTGIVDCQLPRNEKLIKTSMVTSVTGDPAFASLSGNPRYDDIITNLKLKLGGLHNE